MKGWSYLACGITGTGIITGTLLLADAIFKGIPHVAVLAVLILVVSIVGFLVNYEDTKCK